LYKDKRWRFTTKGFILSNTLIGEILEAQTKQRTQISRPWQTESDEEAAQISMFDKRPPEALLFGGKRPTRRHENI
jgi:hypothetical protein